jgi:hypothetical protein
VDARGAGLVDGVNDTEIGSGDVADEHGTTLAPRTLSPQRTPTG